MTQVIFSAKHLKIIEANDGKKYLAGMEINGDSETSEQRRIAALEERITAIETALAGTQAQALITEAKIGDAVISSQSLYSR